MDKDQILDKLESLWLSWDSDDCIDFAYAAEEEINKILISEGRIAPNPPAR